jgi:hypothetical protein
MKKALLLLALVSFGCMTDSQSDGPVVDVDLTKGFAMSASDWNGKIYLWHYEPPIVQIQDSSQLRYYSGPSKAVMVGDCVKITWDVWKDSLCQIQRLGSDSISANWHGIKMVGRYAAD